MYSHYKTIKLTSIFLLLSSALIIVLMQNFFINSPPTPLSSHAEHANLLQLPLMFEKNEGQTAKQVNYLTRTADYMMYFTPQEIVFDFRNTASPAAKHGKMKQLAETNVLPSQSVLRLQFVAANAHPKITGEKDLLAKTNYFIGNDPKKWHQNVPNYGRVHYQNLYPGINMVFYGKHNKLEYDIQIAPNADPKRASFKLAGAKEAALDSKGNLLITMPGHEKLQMHAPVIYQMDHGQKRSIKGNFVLSADQHVGFKVDPYDHSKTLIIDPVIVYSTYLGGSQDNAGLGIDTDKFPNPGVYLTGYTKSTDFPVVNAMQTTNKSHGRTAFVTKVNRTGTSILYSTYLGGSGSNDEGFAIAVDGVGAAYITGETNSKDFPLVHPIQTTNPARDFAAFVTKLNPEGNAIEYSTYLTGSGENQEGNAITVDQQGFAYLTGETTSTDWPLKNPFQSTNKGTKFTAWVAKINTIGDGLVFSTYLGGSGGQDEGNAIGVDFDGFIVVTGETNSKDFPILNALQPKPGPKGAGQTGFVTRFNPNGASLNYSTFWGGSGGNDYPTTLSLDTNGDVSFGGYTNSLDFPTQNAMQTTNRGAANGRGFNGFVSKFNRAGNLVFFSTYIGGSGGNDRVNSLSVDTQFVIHIVGQTNSHDLTVLSPIQATNLGPDTTSFKYRLSGTGGLIAATYLGGSGGKDIAHAVAIDSNLSSYVTGETNSADFPLLNALQTSHPATQMAFLYKVAA